MSQKTLANIPTTSLYLIYQQFPNSKRNQRRKHKESYI